MLLPPTEAQHFTELALYHSLYLTDTLEVYTRIGGKCIRNIQTYTFTPAAPVVKQLYIREADAITYTSEFESLLRQYYLIF